MCLSDFSGCGAEFSKKRERAITTMTIGDENHRRRQIAMYIIETSIYKLPHQNEEHSSKRKEAAQILSWLVPKLTSVGSTLWLARAWQNRGDPPYSIISNLSPRPRQEAKELQQLQAVYEDRMDKMSGREGGREGRSGLNRPCATVKPVLSLIEFGNRNRNFSRVSFTSGLSLRRIGQMTHYDGHSLKTAKILAALPLDATAAATGQGRPFQTNPEL